jgi:hypothetical protein
MMEFYFGVISLVRFVLQRAMAALLGHNPFAEAPPKFVRALYYVYRYTDRKERAQTGAWWTRTLVGIYLPPIALKNFQHV